jgi:transposase
MPSMNRDPRPRRVVIGVNTHKHVHLAVAPDAIAGRLDAQSFPASQDGYGQLLDWAAASVPSGLSSPSRAPALTVPG